jgi:hypothetical protein
MQGQGKDAAGKLGDLAKIKDLPAAFDDFRRLVEERLARLDKKFLGFTWEVRRLTAE